MELQDDSGRRNEIEYLAALIAFKDELIRPVDLRSAIHRLTEGASPSLLDALRTSETVEPSVLAAAEHEARLYLNLPPLVEQRTNVHGRMPSTATAQFADASAGNGEPLSKVFDDISELPEENSAEDFEWKPTSEAWSHVYYIEDTLRSYSGGRLGIVSSLALVLCVCAAAWGIVQSQMFQADAVDSNTISNDQVSVEHDTSMVSKRTPPLPVAALDQPPSLQDVVAISAVLSPELSAPVKDLEVTTEQELASPTLPSPTIAPVLNAGDVNSIDAEVASAIQEIESGNLANAWQRMEVIHRERVDHLDWSNDLRWFQLGVDILLEQDTLNSVQTAGERLKQLCKDEDEISRLLFARWLLHGAPAQKLEFSQLLTDDSAQAKTLRSWLFAIDGHHESAIPMLEEAIETAHSEQCNYFFLAVANFYAGKKEAALQCLDRFSSSIRPPVVENPAAAGSRGADANWLREHSLAALANSADKLRKRIAPQISSASPSSP